MPLVMSLESVVEFGVGTEGTAVGRTGLSLQNNCI